MTFGAAIFFVVFFATREMLDWRAEWPRTSAEAQNQLLFVGPLVATMAHFSCATMHQREHLTSLVSIPRIGFSSVFRIFTIVAIWASSAYLLAIAPLYIHTGRQATYGSIDLLVLAVQVAGIAFSASLGCLVGNLSRRPLLALIAGIAVFLILQSPNYIGEMMAALIPVQGAQPYANQTINPAVSLYRLILLVGLTVALLAGAGAVARRGPLGLLRPSALIVATAMVMLVAIPIIDRPSLILNQTNAAVSCRVTLGVQVCVHQSHAGDLVPLTAVTRRLVSAYGRAPSHLARVLDVAASGIGPTDHTTAVIYFDRGDPVRVPAAPIIADYLAGFAACDYLLQRGDDATYQLRTAGRFELARWLESAAGLRSMQEGIPVPAFLSTSRDQVQRWIQTNQSLIATCSGPLIQE